MKVEKIDGYWVLDSRGNPTVEVRIEGEGIVAYGTAPSGASRGEKEALEIRDNDKDFHGKGVKRAIEIIDKIKKQLVEKDFPTPNDFDSYLLVLDPTPTKKELGGNVTTALSMAFYKLWAKARGEELYKIFGTGDFPKPMFNIINGGKHAGNKLAIQEFMVIPFYEKPSENIKAGSEIYHELRRLVEERYGRLHTSVGDEGGFAPPVKEEEALELISRAIEETGYDNVRISLDCAADSFYDKESEKYFIGKEMDKGELLEYYKDLVRRFKIFSIEDPFYEKDSDMFGELNKEVVVVGDDLTVTRKEFIEEEAKKGNIGGVIIKINQVGTVKEARESIIKAKELGIKTIVSHRSGDTEDSFIADFAFGMKSEFIKSGAPARGERTAKYNRLLRIERELSERERV